MPRITEARREAKRAEIVAAARRCFSRDGFHQTSMPDIAQEAGVSVGASYRYFAGKEEIILEIAGDAFRLIFAPVERLVDGTEDPTVADLVAASIAPAASKVTIDAAGQPVPVDELLRCAVQAWGNCCGTTGCANAPPTASSRSADAWPTCSATARPPARSQPILTPIGAPES